MCDLGDSSDTNSLFSDELFWLQADYHHRPSTTGYTAHHIWNMDKQMVCVLNSRYFMSDF